MTALIYKAALPTYTSLEDLNANAGESLLLNDAGTAYELEPAQGGAYVPGTDWLSTSSDYESTQTLTAGGPFTFTSLEIATYQSAGDSFETATKGVHVIEGTMVQGRALVDVASAVAANAQLEISIYEMGEDGGNGFVFGYAMALSIALLSGTAPYFEIPFVYRMAAAGHWLCPIARARSANIILDDFGGMVIERMA